MDNLGLRKFRSAIAFALVLWCAGAGCMLVSYAHSAAMSGPDPSHAPSGKKSWSGLSASVSTHSCCKARHGSSKRTAEAGTQPSTRADSATNVEQVSLTETPAPSGVMSCCPLTTGSFVVSSRTQSNDTNTAVLAQNDSLSFALRNPRPAPLANPPRLSDQKQTYLRCCVFLI
jgi:hypothetical protein